MSFEQQIGISEDTYLLLKAAKLFAKDQEEKRGLDRDYFRAGNNTFSNDKLLNFALRHYVPDEFIEEVPGLDTGF